jgi:hypothetical protein
MEEYNAVYHSKLAIKSLYDPKPKGPVLELASNYPNNIRFTNIFKDNESIMVPRNSPEHVKPSPSITRPNQLLMNA